MRKDTQGYNYKYFDINQMIDVMKPLLKKHGLTILQPLTNIEGKPALKTIIIHKDCTEQIIEIVPLPAVTDIQKFGGMVTYMRRYALQALLFMQAEDDDAASTLKPQAKKPQTVKEELGF